MNTDRNEDNRGCVNKQVTSGQPGPNPTGDSWEMMVENASELVHMRNEESGIFNFQLPSDDGQGLLMGH